MKFKQFTPTKWTLMFLLLASMLTLMGGAAVSPALPLISAAFPEYPEAVISFIVTLPALAIAFTGYFIGYLSDRFGRVRVLTVSLAIFGLAGVSGYFLDSLELILIGRAVLGIGIAGVTTATTALIAEYYTGITRAKVLGYQAAAMGFGGLILEVGGGALAAISWREPFLIYLLGIFVLLGVLLTVKTPVSQKKSGEDTRMPEPSEKIPVGSLLTAYATVFFCMLLMFAFPTKLPYLLATLNDGAGVSLVLSGFILGIMGLMSAISGLCHWRVSGKLHKKQVIAISFLILSLGLLLTGVTESLPLICLASALVGFGNGMLLPTITNWISSLSPVAKMGIVMGGFTVALNMGQFISSLIAVPILSATEESYAGLFLIFGSFGVLISAIYTLEYLVKSRSITF